MVPRIHCRIALFLALGLVAACAAPVSEPAAGAAAGTGPALPHSLAEAAIAPAVDEARQVIVDAVPEPVLEAPAAAAIVEVRELVQAVMPEAMLEAASAPDPAPSNPLAVALIVRWEVGSPRRYTQRYQRPVWPGGASGVTWGIGYDGGHQTRRDIANDWAVHGQVEQLVSTAGVSGSPAAALTRSLQDVVTPYALAEQVFSERSLPAYRSQTRRAFGRDTETLSLGAQAALESLTYNRGAAMMGDRNREKREIRDQCVPAQDAACIAAQLRSMKRLWPDVRGLRDRRDDEARIALN